MSTLGRDDEPDTPATSSPYTSENKPLMVIAGVLLVIPVIALMAVGLYAKDGPELFGFPFFFWYQLLWVFLCAAMTYTAHRLVLKARGKSHKDIA